MTEEFKVEGENIETRQIQQESNDISELKSEINKTIFLLDNNDLHSVGINRKYYRPLRAQFGIYEKESENLRALKDALIKNPHEQESLDIMILKKEALLVGIKIKIEEIHNELKNLLEKISAAKKRGDESVGYTRDQE